MKISGNIKAVKEIINLIDNEFVPPFTCWCDKYNEFSDRARPLYDDSNTHVLTCEEIGDPFVIYDVTLDNGKISHMKLLHRHSVNIKTGCIN